MLALFNIEALTLLLYFFRDALAGALRYYLDIMKLGPVWFVPDLMALVCISVFTYRYAIVRNNRIAQITVTYMAFSLLIGYFFLQSLAGALSSLKMIAPLFVGFLFAGKYVGEYKKVLSLIYGLFYFSVIAIIVSAYIDLPWTGYTYESFGATRQAGRLWWSSGEVRLAGFAADSTMASFFVLITFVFSSTNRSLLWVLVFGMIGLYAVELTTNKTSLGVLACYIIAVSVVRMMRKPNDLRLLRQLAMLSFICVLVPPFLMLSLSGFDLSSVNADLFSLQDRINNSWKNPFVFMYEIMPTGYFTGCGIGCFNYPQDLFAPQLRSYFVPVDNFYIGTLLMFGPPFVVFMFYVIRAVNATIDPYKLSFVFVMNIFTITVLSYGPASGLLLIGMAFSNVFVLREPARRAMAKPFARQAVEAQPWSIGKAATARTLSAS